MENNYFLLDVSARAESMDFFFPEFFFCFFMGMFPWGHLESILRVLEDDCRNVFAFVLIVFSMVSF